MSLPVPRSAPTDPRLAPLFDDLGRAALLAERVLGDRQWAEDAVQEACMRYIRRPPRDEGPAALRAYFLRAVHGAAVDLGRNEASRQARERICEATGPGTASPAAAAANREAAQAARRELVNLPPDLRTAICLCCEEGLTQREAAEILEVPTKTVADRVRRGLEKLRERLAAAGYAALPAAALAPALASLGVPPPPAALAAKVGALAANARLDAPTGTAAASAAKGGLAMKVILGVVLAGALAGGAALFFGPPTAHRLPPTNLASPPVSGPPKVEHWAFITHTEYLDGPRLEAMCPAHRGGPVDAGGNMYTFTYGAVRVIRADGKVETVAGEDRWVNDLGLSDGPACFLPAVAKGGGYGSITAWLTASGLPLEGEDKGCLYTGVVGGAPYRIFKNKEKSGRWWMQRMGTGKTPLPTEVGKSAAVKDLDLSGAEIYNGYMNWKGNCYRFDEGKGEITCVLTMADYQDKAVHPNPKNKDRKLGVPTQLVRGPDGSFYLMWYYQCYPEGVIFKISPDRSKVELIAYSKNGAKNFDGPALDAGYFGGPYIQGNIVFAGDVVPIGVIDGNCVRRLKDGRTSKLCKDGEWRETRDFVRGDLGMGFKGWLPGPDGHTVWAPYCGEERGGDARMFRVFPVDFTKPTVGPELKMEGK